MIEEKPIAAFTLSVLGFALQVVGAVFFVYGAFFGWGSGFWGAGMMMGPWMMMGAPWSFGFFTPFFALFGVVVVVLGLLGVLWMNALDLSRVRAGSTLVLVASVLAFPTMFGFMVGSLLMFIGGILGLTWQPQVRR